MLPSAQLDGCCVHKNKLPKSRKRKPLPLHEEDHDDDVHKKLMRRNKERLRRQEMATLCASLRFLLPFEYINVDLHGKRSISDHINEAIKYIKHLQKSIKELGAKRDKLRMLSNLNVLDAETRTLASDSASHDPPTKVTVSQCLGGIEIVLSSSITAQMLPLSRFLKMG